MLLRQFRSAHKGNYIPQRFKLRYFCKSVIFDFAFPSFFQMLRVQRVCGKSREGASVPLCIKLQGAVVCARPQQQNNGIGCTCPTESLERPDTQDKQPCSPLTSPVCKSVGPNPEHCEQPHRKEPSSGKVFSFFRLGPNARSERD